MSASIRRLLPPVLLAAALAAPAPAGAAVETGRAPYQAHVMTTCPGNSTFCQVEFLVVQARRRLEITSVSCQASAASPGRFNYVAVRLNTAKGATVYDFLAPDLTYDGTANDGFNATARTLLIASAGDRVLMAASSTRDATDLRCKVAGELVTLK